MIPVRGAPARQRWAWITIGLIAVNVAIFLYQLHIGPQAAMNLFYSKGAVASKLSRLKILSLSQTVGLLPTMFSSMFLHAGWVHLIGNMWFLWVFGEALEDDLGHVRFLGFYFFCGFFAGLFHVLAASSLGAPLIGASGAIAGVLGGYMIRLPKSPIHTVVFWRLRPEWAEIPAFFWLGLWLALQFYGLGSNGAVAWMAHLGGFFMGLLTVNLFTPLHPEPVPVLAKAAPRKKANSKSSSKGSSKSKKK
jgi:membrane associated rhomboid family serine protease